MKYFTIKELIKTNHKVDNTPSDNEIDNIIKLVDNILDPIRKTYGKPIYVNSGYRNPKLNNLVGGSKTSQHLSGNAADITVRSKEGNKELFNLILRMINEKEITVGQLIDEKNYSWIHISNPYSKVNQILHLK